MRRFAGLLDFLLLVIAVPLVAQDQDIPVHNWTVPPYTAPNGGLSTMTDVTPPRVFVGVAPCRIVDTRAGSGFPAGFGSPSLAPGVPRNFSLTGGPCPGLPAGIDAYSLNVTVVNTVGPGHLVIYPQGGSQPTVSSINYVAGQTIANAVIVPAGTGGGVTVVAGVSGTDLLIDINGYFSETFDNLESPLVINNNSSQYSIVTNNSSTTCTGPCGIRANIFSVASPPARIHAISGYALGALGITYGVYGETISTTQESAGIRGVASASGGFTNGVFGETNSSSGAGVRGHATNPVASGGIFTNTTSVVHVANQVSGTNYAIYSGDRIRGGSLEITGMPKNFVAPHPEDPGLEIRYASVEAPTVDVYIRGTAELVNGVARIEVPDHFRLTAREGTYTTTLTPVGRGVVLSVEEEGPEGIVVRGSGAARFHYVVWAERAEIVGFEPVVKNTTFTPEALEQLGGAGKLPAPTRALLLRNGTLNPDGTYNVQTVRAQGWTLPVRTAQPAPVEP